MTVFMRSSKATLFTAGSSALLGLAFVYVPVAGAQSNVVITGGTIDNTTVGSNTPANGTFSQLNVAAPNAGSVAHAPANLSVSVTAPASSSQTVVGAGSYVTIDGSSNAFAWNPLLQWNGTANGFGAVEEIDGNNYSTSSPCRPSSPVNGCVNADGVRVTGSSGHYSNGVFQSSDPMSEAVLITGVGGAGGVNYQWFDGIDLTANVIEDYNIHVNNNASETLYDQGNHTNGLDLNGAYSQAAIVVRNAGKPVLSIDGSGNVGSTGNIGASGSVSGQTVSSATTLTAGSAAYGSQIVTVVGGGTNTSFQLSPSGGVVAAGNTIGKFGYTGAIIALINCEDESSSQTWQLAVNYISATVVSSSPKVLTSAGPSAQYWSITPGYFSGGGQTSAVITINTTSSKYLYCTGSVTVLRQP